MLRKAFFRAFFFLLLIMALANPAFAFYEDGQDKRAPNDSQAPLSNGMTWFVRRVPVLFYDPSPNGTEYNTETNAFSLKNPDLVWGELWTKPEWAQESSRFGLNELYIPINPAMTPAPATTTGEVAVPLDDKTVQTANWIDPKVVAHSQGKDWGADMSDGVYLNMPLPSREAFLNQAAGMNDAQAAKYQSIFGRQIPSADSSVSYYRALDAFAHGSTYYYHLFLNEGPQENNYAVAADAMPRYDERTPTGIGFYRGKDWASNLQSDPGSVPGFIGAITPWCNLKLTGPNEVTGVPGEEKEVEFTAVSEVGSDVTTDVGTKRDGQGQFDLAVKDLTLPAWGKVPVKLKFKVENQPYTVRVMIDPNESIIETGYDDNYIDVTVKPIAPDMYVKTLDPGASAVTPGSSYSGTVIFGLANDYAQPVQGALSLTNNGQPVAGVDGQVVEFKPGEEKSYNFTFAGADGGNTLVAKIHPVNPPDDRDWSNNSKEVYVPPVIPQPSGGSGNLTLQAYSQAGQDIYGNEVPSMAREPGTAKWTDTVKATLTIPQPDLNQILPESILKYNPRITSWQVLGATITYPKRADDFTFGHFVPPDGTVTVNMDYPGDEMTPDVSSVEARASFREDWSTAGAPIYDMETKEMVPGPTEYPIAVKYQIKVKYEYCVPDPDSGKCDLVQAETAVNGSAADNLLVNGTGVNSL
ncbi:hypothetical protein SDD30_14145 [Moorella naiadis]|uniref:hypothetical protein n=1 Tax=Moorella naiadis (nom. illeg.) TaxID=3093670 RepID=UPI003D9C9E09